MEERKITNTQMESYHQYLIREEKSTATVEKYLRDARAFVVYVGGKVITKEVVMAWKKELQIKDYAVRSINSMLASLNSLLDFLGWSDCKVKAIKQQKQVYCAEEKELNKAEYMRLLEAAKNKPQLQLVMQTICGTGIRVSELKFFTVEDVKQGEVIVNCKGKTRTILIPGKLRKLLLDYAKKEKIRSGVIFLTRNGCLCFGCYPLFPLDRENASRVSTFKRTKFGRVYAFAKHGAGDTSGYAITQGRQSDIGCF